MSSPPKETVEDVPVSQRRTISPRMSTSSSSGSGTVSESDPSPNETSDSGVKLSDESRKGSVRTEVPFIKEDLPSKDQSKKTDDDDSDSDSETVEQLYKKVTDAIEKTSLADYLATLGPKLQRIASGEFYIGSADYDDFVSAVMDDTEPPETYSEESKLFLEEMASMFWRIQDNAKRCHARNDSLVAAGKIGCDMLPMKRIFQRLCLLDEDMTDFAKGVVPVVQDLSDVRNLTTVMQYLCNRGRVNVMVDQVMNQVGSRKLISYFNGFQSFRAEDLESLEECRIQLKDALDRWEALCPFVRVFVEETEPLEQMDTLWLTVKMPVSDLEVWHKGLKDLKDGRDQLFTFINDVVRDIMGTLKAYTSIQRDLTFNLMTFLDSTIVGLFKPSSSYIEPTEGEFPVE